MNLVLFLVSDKSKFINGSVVYTIDGGILFNKRIDLINMEKFLVKELMEHEFMNLYYVSRKLKSVE